MYSASQVIETNIVIEIRPSSSSVVAALRDFGSWNAGTPLLIASTPVSAVVPEEKARATMNSRARPAKVSSGTISQSALGACSSSPCAIRHSAYPTMPKMPSMNPYVGMANRVPLSRTPRRFITVSRVISPIDIATACSSTAAYAEPRLSTAAEIETATVSV